MPTEKSGGMSVNFILVTISYLSSLIANVIVLLGAVSLFTWLEKETERNFIARHRNLVLCAMGISFIVLAYGEAWTNGHSSSNLIGFHWTYLNVVIVAVYNLLLRVKTKWILALTLVLTAAWMLATRPLAVVTAGMYAKLVFVMVLECGVYRFADQIQKTAAMYFVDFTIFSAGCLWLGPNLYTQQSLDAWARQIIALVVLEFAVFWYGRTLYRQNIKLEQFRHDAEFDDLTGVHSFGVFNRDLLRLFNTFKTDQQAYSLYALDVDHFKHINDTYGHLAGNEVLKAISHEIDCVVTHVEYQTRLYRTGGEEFTVILQAIKPDAKRAEEISREIQRAINQLRFTFDGQDVRVTISLGAANVLPDDANYLDSYKRADQFLYTSKRSGRNAITLRGRTLARDVS
ncbi:diguanylate cyclase phosphodiesterase domain-containing protein [Secundilactobacillus collinoides DSM 20515 = JCM 1123]|uniref:Diguanylate cyclase phosphodiesterase domain-containing protein n=2 Tax=Secundilactobacillus collinoides TaxID=33960 RepID=A0A0R2BNM6_SECCO|nr:diguanylate cyclase phosphodiesterase domain-containing protein [Secundilactobacillus collinoides DSM 20515 = JCM 1123]